MMEKIISRRATGLRVDTHNQFVIVIEGVGTVNPQQKRKDKQKNTILENL